MKRPARRPRPDWRAVPLLLVALHPAMSFNAVPPHAVWRTPATQSTTTPPSSSSSPRAVSPRAARRGHPPAAWLAVRQQINGQVDVGVPSSASEIAEASPEQRARWEPPDAAASVSESATSCSQEEENQEEHQVGLSKQPPLVARSLDSVRSSLIRQEETIIFSLIEREQFRQNSEIYTKRSFRLNKTGAADIYGRDASFLEYMLCETEKLHATVRRYMSLEELAFFPMFLPEPILPPLDFSRLLAPNNVNVNEEILRRYISEVVPMICEPGDDEQHGSSVVCDVNALQALSRRVHLGKFVAESKFQEDSRTYQALCRAGDVPGVLALLTNKAVEKKVLHRAFMKASTYGSDVNDPPILGEGAADEERNFKVDPHSIVAIYRDFVIPLTKDVEILYLFQRAGYPCPSLEGIHD